MIVFLTLCYCAVLYLLIKLKLIKFNLWWKLSPLVWMVLLLVVLFIPMQWGAPAGTVNVYQTVVEIIPNVAGKVVEVPVKGLSPVEKGEVLFKIDPVPYQAIVDGLEADLAAAEQNVLQLQAAYEATSATVKRTEEQIEVLKFEQQEATSEVTAAEAALSQTEANSKKADALLASAETQYASAKVEQDRVNKLAARDAATPSDVEQAKFKLAGVQASLDAAKADQRVAQQSVVGAASKVEAAKANARGVEVQLQQTIDADLPRAQAEERAAKLAAESMIGGVHTSVAKIQASLEKARYDLEQTVVRAPSAGYVIGATLRPGQRVANLPMRSWMAFVNTDDTYLAVGVKQYAMQHVKPGQPAEIALKVFPGRTIKATVADVAHITPSGQVKPLGEVPEAPSSSMAAKPFGVILKIDEDSLDINQLPAGAIGTAAIYTDSAKATHVIRRVMVRMQTWMNYVIPW